jgi:hypothetical protein
MPEARVSFIARCASLIFLMCLAACPSSSHSSITQDELVRHTQEMFDGVARGDKAPWQKYFAEDSMYFDEKGTSIDKRALVDGITALPPGYSGGIKLVKAKSHIEEETAILTYDLDETETVFGQNMTARYHGTDTWMYREGRWQIVAGQMFRYYEDPAPGKVDAKVVATYVGTYELAPGVTQTVSLEGDTLYAQRNGDAKVPLVPETTGIFFRKGTEGRLLFRRDERGKGNAMIDRRNNEDVVWTKIR